MLAARGDESVSAEAALATICQAYWYPLYAHVRRRGNDPERARDLTQGFFGELLAKDSIARADPERGRFRTFLLAALDHFLHHQHRAGQLIPRIDLQQKVVVELSLLPVIQDHITTQPAPQVLEQRTESQMLGKLIDDHGRDSGTAVQPFVFRVGVSAETPA